MSRIKEILKKGLPLRQVVCGTLLGISTIYSLNQVDQATSQILLERRLGGVKQENYRLSGELTECKMKTDVSRMPSVEADKERIAYVVREEVDKFNKNPRNKHKISESRIMSIMWAESGGNLCSRSPKGAIGLMQVMPKTGIDYGVKKNGYLYEIETNLKIGIDKYGRLLNKYHGDEALALAAYNWGPGNVDGLGDVPSRIELDNQVPRETRNYLAKILGNDLKESGNGLEIKIRREENAQSNQVRTAENKGSKKQVKPIAKQKTHRTHFVRSKETLYKISKDYGVDYRELARYNGINPNKIKVGDPIKIPYNRRKG